MPVSIAAIHNQNLNTEAQPEERHPIVVVQAEPETVEEVVEEVAEVNYFNVPLSEEIQDHIFSECERCAISPALVIAIIEYESQYDASAVGDGGKSVGLMQIQERWHAERMDRLGCTDLLNPFENITVGVDLICELYNTNPDIQWVLMAYNGGTGYANRMMEADTYSDYAVEIAQRAEELERNTEVLMNY